MILKIRAPKLAIVETAERSITGEENTNVNKKHIYDQLIDEIMSKKTHSMYQYNSKQYVISVGKVLDPNQLNKHNLSYCTKNNFEFPQLIIRYNNNVYLPIPQFYPAFSCTSNCRINGTKFLQKSPAYQFRILLKRRIRSYEKCDQKSGFFVILCHLCHLFGDYILLIIFRFLNKYYFLDNDWKLMLKQAKFALKYATSFQVEIFTEISLHNSSSNVMSNVSALLRIVKI